MSTLNRITEKASLPREGSRVPARKGKRPPLEARTNWDPWLPAMEAYPEVPVRLRSITLFVLGLLAFLVMTLIFARLAF